MGYIKIDRDLLQSPFWTSEPMTRAQAWVDLIGLANYADKDKFWEGFYQRVKRGELVTSTRALAERWGWSRAKAESFLKQLESAEMITRKKASRWTTVSICNYNIYQESADTKKATKKPQKDQRPTTERPLADTQEESKESKERERERAERAVVSPSLEEVRAYQAQTGLNVNPDAFWDFYQGTGWVRKGDPIRDWRAVFRSWQGKETYGQSAQDGANMQAAISGWLERVAT